MLCFASIADAQKSNKPRFKHSSAESLGESDNHFGEPKRGIFPFLFSKKDKGQKSSKKEQRFAAAKKKDRGDFQEKKFTGGGSWLNPKNWGIKLKGKEDTKSFRKAAQNKAREKKGKANKRNKKKKK